MNQLHAQKKLAYHHLKSVEHLESRIVFFQKQEAEVVKDMRAIIKKNSVFKKAVELLCIIPG